MQVRSKRAILEEAFFEMFQLDINQFAVHVVLLLFVFWSVVLALFWKFLNGKAPDAPSKKNSPFLYNNGNIPKKYGTCLLVIDPQNDFCDPQGSLFVTGADKDCQRVAIQMRANLSKIDALIVTLDTHQRYHIAHPSFWVAGSDENSHPSPFTTITLANIQNQVWKARNPCHQSWAEEYVQRLDKGGRFQLTIWPEHCLVGTNGHAVYPPLMEVIKEWEGWSGETANFVVKGNNALTEHYSAIKAEVEIKNDESTRLNVGLLQELGKYDKVIVFGEALSHCVNFTVRDLAANLGDRVNRFAVIRDGCSSVPGFETAGNQFIEDMASKGLNIVNSANAFD